jgi:HrpA-like RNA helicase
VGFSVRLETMCSDVTQLLFVTPGVLMRRLNPMIGGEGGRLAEFTHIIMDEVRELNTVTCFLLVLV